uniref:Sigma-54-dependent Fis family transcriptional regulator n=1 Tax=candidate division WOR-3 bacterium TaxID=2052148 RepID=A0A7C4Y3Z2_UNCW3
MRNISILIVDDERSLTDILKIGIENEGYKVFAAYDPETALRIFNDEKIDVVVSDIKMQKISGLQLLRELKKIDPNIVFILITAYSSLESAIEALRGGASDYLVKPFDIEELLFRIENALKKKDIQLELSSLKSEKLSELNIVGESEEIKNIKNIIKKIATLNTNVLITGESGSGKELVARLIHYQSNRPGRFIPLNCASIPENLLESELFGYKKGAFTGAVSDKDGVFKLADKGTLFLDEIAELPIMLQPKILRVIETFEFIPLGGTKTEKVDVRIIAATNKDIENEVKEGKFREDLYYRLNVIPIHIPPLRERKEDIPVLVEHFLEKITKRFNIKEKKISKGAMKLLIDYNWPGNVRELENILERIIVLEHSEIINEEIIKKYLVEKIEVKESSKLEELEKNTIIKTLEENKWNIVKSAKKLGLHPSTLYRKIKKYNISKYL